MAIDRNSNAFTFGFAIAMVVVVGTVLALLVEYLKPLQIKNEKDKKMMSILGAINVESTRKNAAEKFKTYIVDSYVLNSEGDVVESDIDAFDIDVRAQHRDKTLKPSDKRYPLFVADIDGKKYYIMLLAGTGLWGPIWGYVAVEDDLKTIYGARFNHAGETPGLGAQIADLSFQNQFVGKKIRDEEGNFHPMLVSKTPVDQSDKFAVDGITGGTLTSKGLERMLNENIEVYAKYFEKLSQKSVE